MKKQRQFQKLTLNRETLHDLEARYVAGGNTVTCAPTCPVTCMQSCLQYITCTCGPTDPTVC